MTVTMAMPFPVDGVVPAAPPHSLLNVRYRAGDEEVPVLLRPSDDRWMNGVQVYGYPVDLPASWDPCSAGTFRDKDEGSEFPTPLFGSFAVYLPITCSSLSLNRDPDGFAERAEAALDARLSFGVAQALSQGVAAPSTNPFFGDTNADILAGGGAVAAQVGLSYLEDAIGATGQLGMIHATPGTVAAWGIGAGIGNPVPEEGLHSPNGNPIAADGGYLGAQPSGEAAAAAGQAWAFATGPVEVRVGEVAIYDISEVLDRETNDVTYRAERYVVASWDTALQAAVLIDWSP